MTIDRAEPELLTAVCDRCGERQVLDLDVEASAEDIADELKLLGWTRGKPDRHRFKGYAMPYSVIYEDDSCRDCADDTPAPKPLFIVGHRKPVAGTDAFANDPCDEWPRSSVFAAIDLRPDCGHPRGPGYCAHCEAGHPIGDCRPAWKRRA